MKNTLSPVMKEAYTFARQHGGRLVRFPGGLHQPVKWMLANQEGEFFGTSTIEALVKRRYADYTKWQDGRRGPFPIEVTMLIEGVIE